jgi:hypothetical protein
VREQIGEASDRRHTAPIASVTLWAVICGTVVFAVHAATAAIPGRLGSYRTGIITIITFLLAALYSVRKHTLWFSVRWLRLASRLPLALMPFWWHVNAGRATTLERALESTVILVILSGLFGALIHDLLPRSMRMRPNQEVRREDIEAGYHQLYLEAEEAILGHSEDLIQAYLKNVRPLLIGEQPRARLAWATLRGTDPAPRACRTALNAAATAGSDEPIYRDLVEIAARKVRLELNQFNLRLGTVWLKFHLALVMIMAVEIVFHITGVLYFVGF